MSSLEHTVEELERRAEEAWWSGRVRDCIETREQAFAIRNAEGDHERAADLAIALAKDHFQLALTAVGRGWLSRAERLLADRAESLSHGRLARLRALVLFELEGDPAGSLSQAKTAERIAAAHGDRDLLALALTEQGRALTSLGELDAGIALLDEATAAAVAGELAPGTAGAVYCNTISVCRSTGDHRRAQEWTDAAARWCERQSVNGFPGICRVHRAELSRLRGAWPEAVVEADRACEELSGWYVPGVAAGLHEVGLIRLRTGDLEGARDAFARVTELGIEPQPGLALLRLAQGNPAGAATMLSNALEARSDELGRARLLPSFVESAVAAGELDSAHEAAEELERTAAQFRTVSFRAAANEARARVLLARGKLDEALRHAREALRGWLEVDAPFEAAHARLLVAEADGERSSGVSELETALSSFERLGAVPAAHRAQELLARRGRRGQRAGRTFLFTDIAGSTGLLETIGDQAWERLAGWHDRTLRACFAAHEGEEIDQAGDGFFVSFPDAMRAIDCALTIQRSLEEHRRAHGFAPQVRIGLHAAEATRSGQGYRGKGVHEAARIAALAQGGEILASLDTVRDLERVEHDDPRTVELKGLTRPLEVVSISWD